MGSEIFPLMPLRRYRAMAAPSCSNALAKHQSPVCASTLMEHERCAHLNGLAMLSDEAAQELRQNPHIDLAEKFRR